MLRYLSVILFVTLLAGPSFAQQVNIQIVKPLPLSGFEGTLNNLVTMGDQFLAIVVQPSYVPGSPIRRINLTALLTNKDNSVGIATRTSTPLELNGPQLVVAGRDLPNFFDVSTIVTKGIDQSDFLSGGNIPEGIYRLCVAVYDANVGDGFSSQIAQINCVPLAVESVEPSRLVSVGGLPFSSNTVVPKTKNPMLINWTPSLPPGGLSNYIVTIVDMGDATQNPEVANLDPNVAIQQNRQPSYTIGWNLPIIVVGSGGNLPIQFESNHRYAVVVQTIAPSAALKNNGFSEVKSFWFDKTRTGSGSNPKPDDEPDPTKRTVSRDIVLKAYPQDGNFMPFRGMPIIVKYDPYSNDYKRFDSEFTITGLSLFKRDPLGWPNGPLAAQRNNTGDNSLTEEDAQYIAISQNKKHASYNSLYVNGLVRGKTYNWNASVWISGQALERDNDRKQDMLGSFKAGMGPPTLQLPANKDTLKGGDISFDYRTAQVPGAGDGFNFNKCFDIVQASRKQVEGFAISIHEKAVLEVSAAQSFSSVMLRDSITLKKAFDQGENGEAIQAYVYSNQTEKFTITEKGTYYWRVRWLTNPNGPLTGASYSDSETWQFTIGEPTSTTSTTATTGDTPPQVAKDCKADCNVPLPANQTAVGMAANVVVKVGHFTLRITSATVKAGSTYDGEGVITNFSLWGYEPELKVSFTNLKATKVDTYLQAFAGEVNTLTAGHELLNLTEMVLGQPLTLPLGFDFMFGGNRFILQIKALKFLPTKAEASIQIAGHIPGGEGDERKYDLMADPVCIVPGGFGKPARFYLNANIYGSAETDSYQFYVKGREEGAVERSSFVEFKCDTLSMQLAGGLRFPRTKLLPEDDLGNTIAGNVDAEFLLRIDQRVSRTDSPAGVTTTGMVAGVTFNHPFQVVGMEGWGFKMEDAFVDLSDMSNPPDMQFPAVYNFASWLPDGQQANEQLKKTWKGVYGKAFALRLPKSLTESRKSFGVNGLIIDKTGLTLSVEAENILTAEEAGWGFSIDKLALSVVQTSTFSGTMKGKIQLPIFDPGDRLDYNMLLSSQPISSTAGPNYICTVSVPSDEPLNMNLWVAQVVLDPNSQVEFSLGGASKMRLKGILNGSVDIVPGDDDKLMGMKVTDVRFENFSFDSDSPGFFTFEHANYSRAGGMPVVSFASPQHSAGKLPITINEIDFVTSTAGGYVKPGLHIDADLALSDKFTAGLALTIYGKMKLDGVKALDVGYDHTDLEAIRVDVEQDGFSLKGEVRFYKNDALYGNGFYGTVAATMPMKIAGKLTVRFGSKGEAGNPDYYSYWFVDGMIYLKTGISLGALTINAFGGGAYHHMRLQNPAGMTAEAASILAQKALKEPEITPNDVPASGLTFVPDKNIYLGIRAGVVGSIVSSPTIFNMDVGLTAEITSQGGLNSISINGNGYLLQDLDKRENPPMKASVLITYDRSGESFRIDGNFTVMVDFYGMLTGRKPGKIAGEAQLHIDQDTWHFYLGSLEQRAGLVANLAIGNDTLAKINMDAYFLVGHGIPTELPPLPDFVRNLLNGGTGDKLDNQATSDSRQPRIPEVYQKGKGIAFGASIDLHYRPTFLIFFADIRLVEGFDINISKSDNPVVCEGSNDPRGVNDWYGQGQAYAGIKGKLGIHVDILVAEGDFVIAELGAAISMQAKLPNPTYFAGRAALYYSILDGWVDGYCNFNIELGDKCIVANNSPLGELKFISDMQPDAATEQSPSVEVMTGFYFPMNKELELEELKADNSVVIRKFKPFIKRYELFETRGNSTTLVADLTQRLERNNAVAMLAHRDYLKGNTHYKATIEIQAYETTSGSEVLVKKPGTNTPVNEVKTITFTTGPLPQTLENVVDAWPIQNQRFFLQNEGLEPVVMPPMAGDDVQPNYASRGKKGYIKVADAQGNNSQAYLFTNSPAHDTHNAATDSNRPNIQRAVSYKAVFTQKSGSAAPIETNMIYYDNAQAIEFDIPQLANNTIYRLDIVRKVRMGAASGIDVNTNVSMSATTTQKTTTYTTRNRQGETVAMAGGNSTFSRKSAGILGNAPASEPPTFVVMSYSFRTSNYNNHREKLALMTLSPGTNTFLLVRTWTAETEEAFEGVDFPTTIGAASPTYLSGQAPLMRLDLPDMDNAAPLTVHQKFKAFTELKNGYAEFQTGISHERNISGVSDLPASLASLIVTGNANLKLSLKYNPTRLVSRVFAPPVQTLNNLLGNGQFTPMPFKRPYYVSGGLADPITESTRFGGVPGVVTSVAASNSMQTMSVSSAGGVSVGSSAPAVSAGNGKPKASIQDMTNLVLTMQYNQMIENLYGVKTRVPATLPMNTGSALVLLNPAEKTRLQDMINRADNLEKFMKLPGKQRMRFTYWVPTMYGSYPTAGVLFEGTVTN